MDEAHMQDERSRNTWTRKYARAYLLFLIGTLLFPENHKTDVFVDYLLFLKDLTPDVVNGFAWGAAVLAKLQSAFLKKSSAIGAMWIVEVCDLYSLFTTIKSTFELTMSLS